MNELKIGDVVRELWQLRVSFAAIVILGTTSGALVGFLRDKYYEATVTFTTVVEEGGASRLGSLGALASQYGGLASLAGISLSGGGRRDEYIAVLQSEFLTEKYIRDHDLLTVLFSNKWDPDARRWKSISVDSTPTVWKANRYFKQNIRNVIDEKKTGLVSLRIKWKDPIIAANWANDLVNLTNSYLRDKAIRESERNIAYLNEQGAKTESVEARRVIYVLLQEEINKAMLAKSRDEYALRVIDPAVPPEKPSTFGPAALGLLGMAITSLGFFLFVFFRHLSAQTTV